MRLVTNFFKISLIGAVMSASTAVQGAWAQDTGVTDTTIKIGLIAPFTGPAASYSEVTKTDQAYIDMLNAEGGVCGRQIEAIAYDDAYSPPKTLEQARKLVEEDGVFLIFHVIGTGTNAAIHDYMNSKQVPQLLVSSGASKWGQPDKYPWTMGLLPSYAAEGKIYAKYIMESNPDGRIGILYQNDDFGKDYIKGLRAGLGDKADAMIISEQPYVPSDADVDAQIENLKASGADIFLDVSIPKFTALAIEKANEIDWEPVHFLTSVSTSVVSRLEADDLQSAEGIISANFLKDAQDPQWKDDEGVKKWNAFMDKYRPEGSRTARSTVMGYAATQALEHVLKASCDNLTRAGVMKAAASMRNVELDVTLPGITLTTSDTDFYPIEQMQLIRYNGQRWELFGGVIDASEVAN